MSKNISGYGFSVTEGFFFNFYFAFSFSNPTVYPISTGRQVPIHRTPKAELSHSMKFLPLSY